MDDARVAEGEEVLDGQLRAGVVIGQHRADALARGSIEQDHRNPFIDDVGESQVVLAGDSVHEAFGLGAEHRGHLGLGMCRVVVGAGQNQRIADRIEDVSRSPGDACLI